MLFLLFKLHKLEKLATRIKLKLIIIDNLIKKNNYAADSTTCLCASKLVNTSALTLIDKQLNKKFCNLARYFENRYDTNYKHNKLMRSKVRNLLVSSLIYQCRY